MKAYEPCQARQARQARQATDNFGFTAKTPL
jgi:hypothetical protein